MVKCMELLHSTHVYQLSCGIQHCNDKDTLFPALAALGGVEINQH